jgi:hypothetical protein
MNSESVATIKRARLLLLTVVEQIRSSAASHMTLASSYAEASYDDEDKLAGCIWLGG